MALVSLPASAPLGPSGAASRKEPAWVRVHRVEAAAESVRRPGKTAPPFDTTCHYWIRSCPWVRIDGREYREVMFRVTFLVDDPAERQRLAAELRALTMGGATRVVSVFANAKTVEVFLDIAESVADDVVDQLAQSLGVDAYEITSAAPLATPTGNPDATDRRHLRRAVITQVRVHPDGRTFSVQARHRPYETVERVDVEQTDQAVTITALVGSPEEDDRDRYVSLAVAFTWFDTVLDRPLGGREVIRDDPDRRLTRSRPSPVAPDQVVPERLVDATESESNADAEVATWSAWRPHLL